MKLNNKPAATLLGLFVFCMVLSENCRSQNYSTTQANPFGGGYTTRYSDGSSARTQANPFGGGYTTRYNNGTTATTRANAFGNGYRTTYSR